MMPPDLEIDLLRTLTVVAETRNFTKAAARLGRVQSAISMQIKRLEELVGSRVLEREQRRVALTPDGERLLSFAHRILRLNDEALSDMGRLRVEGSIRFGVAEVASYYLDRVLPRFTHAYPLLRLEIQCARSWDILDALEAGHLDLGLVSQPCGRGGGTMVFRDPLGWAAAEGSPVPTRSPLPIALFAQGCAYRERALRALDAEGISWRESYSSTNPLGMIAAVGSGLAVGTFTRTMLQPGMRMLGEPEGLPALGDVEILLFGGDRKSETVAAHLARDVVDALRSFT